MPKPTLSDPMPQLVRADLDQMVPTCCTEGQDGFGELWFHQRCHPGARTWTCYDRIDAAIIVVCAECSKEVVRVAVAKEVNP